MQTFREWFTEHLADSAQDIANHGADAGYPEITYTIDCVALFDKFGSEIWDMAVQDAEDMGCKNVAEMIAGFSRADMLCDLDQFKNIMVWYACESVARDYQDMVADAQPLSP